MSVTAVTYYSVSATYNGVTWTSGPQLSEDFDLRPNVQSFGNNAGGTQNIGYVQFGSVSYRGYPQDSGWSSGGTKNGPYTVRAGTQLHGDSPASGFSYYRFDQDYYCTVQGSSTVSYSGQRTVTAQADAYGSISVPATGQTIAAGNSAIVLTRPEGNMEAAASILTLTATGSAATGTLTTQGYAQAQVSQWTWPSTILSSGSQTAAGVASGNIPTIVFSLRAGAGDASVVDGVGQNVKVSFTRALNPSTQWSPIRKNIVVHILDDSLVEVANSADVVTDTGTWGTFRTGRFSAFTCTSGSASRNWYTSPTGGAYLLNVTSAVFSITPAAGMYVHEWKLKTGAGWTSFGSGTAPTITGFTSDCEIHVYLTSALVNPRIVYDGFDTSGIVPANQDVIYNGGASYPVGSKWTSVNSNPISITLSPVAWATRLLGQRRSVIVDGTEETELANVNGSGAGIQSSAAQYSVTRVKFKQTQLATDGTLTVTVVQDVVTPLAGVSIALVQESTAMGAPLTGSGTFGYYVGAGALSLSVNVDYGEQSPDDFIVRMVPSDVYSGDVIGATASTLSAVPASRAVTIYITQIVTVGSLSAVDINLSRDVGIGTQIATSSGPVTQCYAGSVAVTMLTGQRSADPIYLECSAAAGYELKSVRILSADGAKQYYSGPAPTVRTGVFLNMPSADLGANLKVVLVVGALIVGQPSVAAMLPDDAGKFATTITSVGGYGDFRVGDLVKLVITPILISGSPMTGVAIGTPTFNDIPVSITRNTVSVEITVTLTQGANLVKVPVYVLLAASTTPAGAGASATVTWDVEDTLIVSAATYRRIGSVFTVSVPRVSSGYTTIAAKISRRSTTSGEYIQAAFLSPQGLITDTNLTYTNPLRGPTECLVYYAQGVQYPTLVCAAYDYATASYISVGARPEFEITPQGTAALGDNTIATLVWPETTPGEAYEAAAYLALTATSTDLLPRVEFTIHSSVIARRLEVWEPTTGEWLVCPAQLQVLSAAFTFFRAAIGEPPENLVAITVQQAVDGTNTERPGGTIYATSGSVYDGVFKLPATLQARARSVLHARVTPPFGYAVVGWYIDGVLSDNVGVSISLIVPDLGLTIKPLLALQDLAPMSVMVLNADPVLTDDGMWVSKLFRAQQPWKPLTAHVVAKPTGSAVTLAVMKDGGPAPTGLDDTNPGTVIITVDGDKMRRLPPGQIQKSRFVRYMVAVNGDVTVSSVAVGSGAETMKGGH